MIAEALLVFTVSWWIALFIALPIRVEVDESSDKPLGCASSAPKNARLLLKVLVATGISLVLTSLYCYLKHKGYVDVVFSVLYKLAP